MIGVKSLVTLVKNKWPHVTSQHCSLHQYTLKTLPLHLMEVMVVAVKVINFIRSRTKYHRLFQLLVKEMGAQHMGLFFISKSVGCRWANAFSWLCELKNEVEIFLRENKINPHVQFHNEELVMMLATWPIKDKLAGLTARIRVWQAQIKVASTTSFPLLERCLKMNRIDLPDNIKNCIIEHLEIVSAELRS